MYEMYLSAQRYSYRQLGFNADRIVFSTILKHRVVGREDDAIAISV
jgi:hypothetical protein